MRPIGIRFQLPLHPGERFIIDKRPQQFEVAGPALVGARENGVYHAQLR